MEAASSSRGPLNPGNAAHDLRVTTFLGEAGLRPPPSIPPLARLPYLDFESSAFGVQKKARDILVLQRMSEPGYRSSEFHVRDIFASKAKKEARTNPDKWIFTKHEVGKAFNQIMVQEPLVYPPGLAQALLSHVSITSLDELWIHLHDPELEKNIKRRSRSSKSLAILEPPWLDAATAQNNIEYIRLLCQTGLGQESLDRAFSIAILTNSMEAMQILLSFGATANFSQLIVKERLESNDIVLARLLISAGEGAMSLAAWRFCIEPLVSSMEANLTSDILLLCFANRPDVVSEHLLVRAVEAQNFQPTAILLSYAGAGKNFHGIEETICQMATNIRSSVLRLSFFSMLCTAGLVLDGTVMQKELFRDVTIRELPLVEMLVAVGISVDKGHSNALFWAISHMDLDLVELLMKGSISSPISYDLDFMPQWTSEADMVRLINLLGASALDAQSLDFHLACAVGKGQGELVNTLLYYGASVEYEQAACIKNALRVGHLSILRALLEKDCSPAILSTVIPDAMALQPREIRLAAFTAILRKGIESQKLASALIGLISEAGEPDLALFQLFLQHNAPIDPIDGTTEAAVLVAALKGNLSMLGAICDLEMRNETLSQAVPIAFGLVMTGEYSVALNAIKLLLGKGARGPPVNQALISAAQHDSNLEIVNLLLANGADPNYEDGAAYIVALKTANIALLVVLCVGCPPVPRNLKSLIQVAVDPRYFNLVALDQLLGAITSIEDMLDPSWLSHQFISNPNISVIVSRFIQHGMNINTQSGALLSLAINQNDANLLDQILTATPNVATLKAGFKAATNAKPEERSLDIMKRLLDQANSAEIGQSDILLQYVHNAKDGRPAGLELLLLHKADIDFDDGKAVQSAAITGSLEVLNSLISLKPSPATINKACRAAAASTFIDSERKQEVFELLLTLHGDLSQKDLSKLLFDTLSTLPDFMQLPALLLSCNAVVQPRTFEVALLKSSQSLFKLLADSKEGAQAYAVMFRLARNAKIDSERKLWIYQYFLERGLSEDQITEALIDIMKAGDFNDLTIIKLLIRPGIITRKKGYEIFALALRSNSLNVIILLAQFIGDDKTARATFDQVRKSNELDNLVRLEVYRCILQWSVGQDSLSSALQEHLEKGNRDMDIINLLLSKGADPNKNSARCFILAATTTSELTFRALSSSADPRKVLKALMKNFDSEEQVVKWFQLCLKVQPLPEVKDDDDDILFLCLRKFPGQAALLRLLLSKGASPLAKVKYKICDTWSSEPCTTLIWALFSKSNVSYEAILALLDNKDSEDLIAFATPTTGLTAAFACLFDTSRTAILRKLLSLYPNMVKAQTISGSSLGHLGSYPKKFNAENSLIDPSDALHLGDAAMYLGNFDAFCVLDCGQSRDDLTLHLAALLALPKIVEWLLKSKLHDPNLKSEEFRNMIPLALACESKHHTWSKIANSELVWPERQKKTIQLLAAATTPGWREKDKGRTVLHIAIHNGLAATQSLVSALDITNDLLKDERYLYVDLPGVEYSPDEYVRRNLYDGKDLAAHKGEINALCKCLSNTGMKSRYFRRIKKGDGKSSQPKGSCGIPVELGWD